MIKAIICQLTEALKLAQEVDWVYGINENFGGVHIQVDEPDTVFKIAKEFGTPVSEEPRDDENVFKFKYVTEVDDVAIEAISREKVEMKGDWNEQK